MKTISELLNVEGKPALTAQEGGPGATFSQKEFTDRIRGQT